MDSPESPNEETYNRWANDPNNWKWGMFYYNRRDKRGIVPKRNPMFGITVNFANRAAVFVFVLMLAFFFFVSYMIERNSGT